MKRLLYAVLLIAGATLVPLAPASAAACSGTSGVTVVVQFPDHTDVRCAPGDPDSGFSALSGAGFSVTRVTRFPGAVCQIDSYPDTSCENMPPASAYWVYFYASAGGSWIKSSYGAGNRDPKPGTVEGWRFGSGAEPSTPPPGSPAPTPTRTVKPTPTPTPAKHTTSASHPAGATVAAPSATPTAPDATATATAGKPTGSPSASESGTVSPSPTASDGAAASEPRSVAPKAASAGASRSWIWGVVLVGVLGAAVATTAVRRRGN